MRVVELKTAFCWHCEDCGTENFGNGVKAEFVNADDKELAFRKFHDMDQFEALPDQWTSFEMVTIPPVVTCTNCGAEFKTRDERVSDGDDEDEEHQR